MLTLDQFDYHLPKERIAHEPMQPRDHSRLLTLNRQTGEIHHHHFYDLPKLLNPNTVIVRNNTKVIPARLFGTKTSGGQVELLLTKRLGVISKDHLHETWEVISKPGLKPNQVVTFPNSKLTATCTEITGFTRTLEFSLYGQDLFNELLAIGHTPIPPYIPAWDPGDEPELRQRYQTTFAKHQGSAAAPTAGLHFTPELDQALLDKGVQIEEVTLHVGLGTFLRVKTDDITDHTMHQEWFNLDDQVAERLNQAKNAGAKILAVGTTTTRVLESCATGEESITNSQNTNLNPSAPLTSTYSQKLLVPQTGQTQLYVYPPRAFNFVDQLITNFHEPKSTLLMLVSAFVSEPNTNHPFTSFVESSVGQAYQTALAKKYRLLSFGDGMFIF